MYCMFGGCSKITIIDISSFNTQNVTNMCGMFVGCSNLTNIDLSSFNTQNATKMSKIFDECYNLKEIKINKTCGEKIKYEIDEQKIIIKYID